MRYTGKPFDTRTGAGLPPGCSPAVVVVAAAESSADASGLQSQFQNGRTSTLPNVATGCSAAISITWSSVSHSMTS